MSRTTALRADALSVCTHQLGVVSHLPSQRWVTVEGVPLLVEGDPLRRPIAGCPNLTVSTKPCTSTVSVDAGYSTFISIGGKALCLETVTGRTDGTGEIFQHVVISSGQSLVAEV